VFFVGMIIISRERVQTITDKRVDCELLKNFCFLESPGLWIINGNEVNSVPGLFLKKRV
jgi:hypothetical protein